MANTIELDASVPVLLLKIGRHVLHHGVLGIARSLGVKGVPVYAVAEERFAPVGFSRYTSGILRCQTRGVEGDRLVATVGTLGEELGRRAILVPIDDDSAAFIGERGGALRKWFRIPEVAPDLPRRLANKQELYKICTDLGEPCAKTAFPACQEDVDAFLRDSRFPIVVKAAESSTALRGTRSTSIAKTPAEAASIRGGLNAPAILQEYIPPESGEDWIFHGYRGASCFAGFTGRKLRSYPAFAGFTTLGMSRRNDVLARQAEALLTKLDYRGIVDLDYRFDKRDGKYKLLDFNPRIGANFRMSEDRDGLDVIRALHLDLTGRPVEQRGMIEGKKLIVEPYDVFAGLAYRREGLSMAEWWRSLKGTRELAVISRRDPLPSAAVFARLVFRALSVLAR